MPATAQGFPYAGPDDPPDLGYHTQQLAQATEDKALLHTAATGPRRVHVETGLTATTDASGYATFAHGAPFTPRLSQVVVAKNAMSLAYVISQDPPTATQVTARFGVWNATGTLNSSSLGTGAITVVSWE